MKFYAAQWAASAPVAIDECFTVLAFRSKKERDTFIENGVRGSYYGSSQDVGAHLRTWSREPLTRDEAARYLSALMRGAMGGRQNGFDALRQL